VQCSTFPLPNNPYQAVFTNLASVATNFDQILKPDQQMRNTNNNESSSTVHHQFPKRYSKPTISQTTMQMIIHLMVGFLFASIVLPDTFPSLVVDGEEYTVEECHSHVSSDLKYLFLISCAFTSAFVFMVTYYSGNGSTNSRSNDNYHVLSFDKKTLPFISVSSLWSVIYKETIEQIQASSVLFYWIISPIAAFGLIHLTNGGNLISAITNECPGLRKQMFLKLMTTYLTTLLMCLYTMTIDICTRKFLTTRGLNIYKLVSQLNVTNHIKNDKSSSIRGGLTTPSVHDVSNELAIEDLVTSVILAGLGTEITDDVSCPRLVVQKDGNMKRPEKQIRGEINVSWVPSSTQSFGNIDLEEEEVRRNNALMDKVATSIVTGAVCAFSSFEEDLLKFNLLESLGGGDGPSTQQSQNVLAPFGLSKRHYNNLIQYLKLMNQASGSLGTLSIVRALCAYAGGTGEALSRITANSPLSAPISVRKETFSLPVPACLSEVNAIKAAARLIILNMSSKRTRFNRLSLFVPVVLQAIYRLRCGVFDYVHYLYETMDPVHQSKQDQARGETFSNFLTMKCPEMSKVLTSCDDTAVTIIKFMKKIDGKGTEIAELKVDDSAKDWLNSLL
jgi:hypothetical protein